MKVINRVGREERREEKEKMERDGCRDKGIEKEVGIGRNRDKKR